MGKCCVTSRRSCDVEGGPIYNEVWEGIVITTVVKSLSHSQTNLSVLFCCYLLVWNGNCFLFADFLLHCI